MSNSLTPVQMAQAAIAQDLSNIRDLHVTPEEYSGLRLCLNHGFMTGKMLADLMDRPHPAATTTLNNLVNKGWLFRHERDHNRQCYVYTPAKHLLIGKSQDAA